MLVMSESRGSMKIPGLSPSKISNEFQIPTDASFDGERKHGQGQNWAVPRRRSAELATGVYLQTLASYADCQTSTVRSRCP